MRKKLDALLMKIDAVYDASVEKGLTFDEVDEYALVHEIVEVIKESADKPGAKLTIVKNDA